MKICKSCYGIQDEKNPALTVDDAGVPGGMSGCGDHHHFVPAEQRLVRAKYGQDGARRCKYCGGDGRGDDPSTDCPCCEGAGWLRAVMVPARRVIVTRHHATVLFIRQELPEFREAPVLASAEPDDVRGLVVAGNLPLHLAALADHVIAVEFAGQPPRGREYGLDEMRAAGAQLVAYRVARHDLPCLHCGEPADTSREICQDCDAAALADDLENL